MINLAIIVGILSILVILIVECQVGVAPRHQRSGAEQNKKVYGTRKQYWSGFV